MRALTLWCAATLFGGLIFGCAGLPVKTETVSTPKPAGWSVKVPIESPNLLYVCGFLSDEDIQNRALTCVTIEAYMAEFNKAQDPTKNPRHEL